MLYECTGQQQEADFSEPAPKGQYRLCVSGCTHKQFSNGDGTYLWTEYEFTEGPQRTRKIFDILVVQNNSGAAEGWLKWANASRGRLEKLCQVKGITGLQSPNDLIGIMFAAKVGIEVSNDPQYTDKNKVTSILGDHNSLAITAGAPAASAIPSIPSVPQAAPSPLQQAAPTQAMAAPAPAPVAAPAPTAAAIPPPAPQAAPVPQAQPMAYAPPTAPQPQVQPAQATPLSAAPAPQAQPLQQMQPQQGAPANGSLTTAATQPPGFDPDLPF